MSTKPTIFIVKPEQVKGQDINEFLRNAIAREFQDKDYMIASESVIESTTHYSKTPRKLKGFALTVEGVAVTIYFDITDAGTVSKNKHSWSPW